MYVPGIERQTTCRRAVAPASECGGHDNRSQEQGEEKLMRVAWISGAALILTATLYTFPGCARRVVVTKRADGTKVTHVHRPFRSDVTIVEPAQESATVVVKTAPPALKVEVKGRAPSKKHVWIAGCWAHRGGHWVWKPGHWEVRPRSRAVWVGGRWKRTGSGWKWVPGHWR